jgi:hypothetical protein
MKDYEGWTVLGFMLIFCFWAYMTWYGFSTYETIPTIK